MQHDALNTESTNSPLWLNTFVSVYQKLSINNLELLDSIYHKDITFEDPIHRVDGLENLHQYFENLYQNLTSCKFVIKDVVFQDSSAAIYWEMTYQHPKLNKGKTVTVFGNSHIKVEQDKVIYHRDYIDLGAMLYEQLPILGKFIRWIKLQATK